MSRKLIPFPENLYPPDRTQAYDTFADQTVDLLGADIIIGTGAYKIATSKAKKYDQIRSDLNKLDVVLEQGLFASTVDNFQCYLTELLLLILDAKPEALSGGQTKNSIIFDSPDIDSLRRHVIERHVINLGYKRIDELDEYFRDRFKFPLTNSEFQSLRLTRIIQIRNVIAHNRGLVSSTFLSRAGSKRDRLNELVSLPNLYAVQNFLRRIALRIDSDAISKFGLPTI